MTATCPRGHQSRDEEYCDRCGQSIDAAEGETPPRPSITRAASWVAIAWADHTYFDSLGAEDIEFPAHYRPRHYQLDQQEYRIGRRSHTRGIAPEIDLSVAPEDLAISHVHAFLVRQDDGCYAIVDSGSTNGTTLNDCADRVPVNLPVPLDDGDRIHIGHWTTITLHALDRRRGVSDLRAPAESTEDVDMWPTNAGPTGRSLPTDAEPVRAPAHQAGSDPSTAGWLLCMDLQGSTLLRQRSRDRYASVLKRCAAVASQVCDRFGGAILGALDDTTYIAFARAIDAANAALAILADVGSMVDLPGTRVGVRVGIHFEDVSGTVPDVKPVTTNTSRAVCTAGHGGQVLISQTAADAGLAVAVADMKASLLDLGTHRLADLGEPRRIYQLLHPSLTPEFPPLRTLDDRPHNLPIQPTRFIGRGAEADDLARLITTSRLCTVTGPGGVGKTRLTLQVAARVINSFPDGVWVADLAGTPEPDLISAAVAAAVGLREGGAGTYAAPGRMQPRSMTERLVEHLGDTSALLILNNCEHVLNACKDLAQALLHHCPTVRVVVTSREALRLPGEAIYRLGPLGLPARWDFGAALQDAEATRLFINRALTHNPDLIIDGPALINVATICERVDGIPFAIELAAARTKILPLRQIAEMLETHLDLPEEADAVIDGGVPTLRAMIDWSHKLLSDRERTLLRRLSVFAGGFGFEAVGELCSGRGLERFEMADLLKALVGKSLVEIDTQLGRTRYRLLETTRQYAEEQLNRSGEQGQLRTAHLAWYQAFAERAETHLAGPDQAAWFDALEADHENLLAALTSGRDANARDDLRLAASLAHYWLVRGRLSEGAVWLDDALVRYPQPVDPLRAKALCGRAMLASFAGDLDRAEQAAAEVLSMRGQFLNKGWEARGLAVLGLARVGRGRFAEAEQRHNQALSACREASDSWLEGFVLTNLGNTLALRGRTADARSRYEEGLSIRNGIGDAWGLAWVTFRLGSLTTWEGRFPDAIELLEQSLRHARSVRFDQGELLALLGLAEAFYVNGDQPRAEARYHEALATAREIDEPTGACLAAVGLASVALARNDVATAAQWLTEEEAIHADRTLATLAAVKVCRASVMAARGDYAAAEALHRDVLDLRRELGDHRGMIDQLEELALTAGRRGRLKRAAVLLAAASAKRTAIELPVPIIRKTALDLLTIRVATGSDAEIHAAWGRGMQATLEDVVSFAISEDADFDADLTTDRAAAERTATHTHNGLDAAGAAWTQALRGALADRFGESGGALFQRYGEAFPPEYWTALTVHQAMSDIHRIEELDGRLQVHLERVDELGELLRLRLFHATPLALTDVLPLLENAGARVLDERPYLVRPSGRGPVWIYDFGLTCPELPADALTAETLSLFELALADVWYGAGESDGFNRLILNAGLPARDVSLLRAYGRYLTQIANAFSLAHMERTLATHPQVAAMLVDLFYARFDPHIQSTVGSGTDVLERSVNEAIDLVNSLDEDRILRSYLRLMMSTVRTNYFQRTAGQPRPTICLKLDGATVPDLPNPRPMFEIYVYSPTVEGVHLRGGPVARGGIRWSDRVDFRTEILGLMKAQTVKNTVIVPVGAKGGFVVRRPPPTRQELAVEVQSCYRDFIRGLLDVTDNLADGAVTPPAEAVRHDQDDPYLVVAADKGTATFSDLANSVSAECDFWLGDAFASGGSAGYDHKKLAITARGAWESVKRHFDQFGVDPDTDDITVVGIGDMSGDVFGNGVLRSRHIKLIGAFDHRHIFLDPAPDPESTFVERLRLFELPESSWQDFDPALISAGGGVFTRHAKSIALSPEMKSTLKIDADTLTPDDLIRALLCAPVDLFWNGGIGTFVKSSGESHADVSDKTNDGIRVDAERLRCRVVAEGGNLGFTQRGRVAFALTGGLINTDAIDNSAGVDCSDHEVNIKILLRDAIASGHLDTNERKRVLTNIEGDVCALVLRDNHLQAQALARLAASAPSYARMHLRYIQSLSLEGQLDRTLEHLPTDKEFSERIADGRGLTRPELAVLLAHTKMLVYDELLASDTPDEEYLAREIEKYFPRALGERFPGAVNAHPLRREIIATALANDLVNRQEITFCYRLLDQTGAAIPDVVRAYVVARDVLGMPAFWADIEALHGCVPAALRCDLLSRENERVEWTAQWLLQHVRPPSAVAAQVASYLDETTTLLSNLAEFVAGAEHEAFEADVDEMVAAGVPTPLAQRVATASILPSPLDVVAIAKEAGEPLDSIAATHFAIGERLQLSWLRAQIDALPHASQWEMLARLALREDLQDTYHAVMDSVLAISDQEPLPTRLEKWLFDHAPAVARASRLIADLRSAGNADAAALGVALREVTHIISTATSTHGDRNPGVRP